MANDIQKSINANNIKHGTLLVATCGATGFNQINDSFVILNKPPIADIESKYDERFDDPAYYYGIGNEGILGT